jgi:hypothetical protein
LGGIYLDGLADPIGTACANLEHGCGYVDSTGTHPTAPILGTRELMKELYGIVKSIPGPTCIAAHTSSSILLPCLSFADVYLDGEHLNRFPEDSLYTLASFRAEMMGHPFGIPAVYLDYRGNGKIERQKSIMYSLLHNMVPFRIFDAADVLKACDEFGASQATWIPYWRQGKPVTTTEPNCRISTYLKPGRGALCIIANVGKSKTKADVTIDCESTGLRQPLTVKNITENTLLKLDTNTVTILVEPGSAVLVQIQQANQNYERSLEK